MVLEVDREQSFPGRGRGIDGGYQGVPLRGAIPLFRTSLLYNVGLASFVGILLSIFRPDNSSYFSSSSMGRSSKVPLAPISVYSQILLFYVRSGFPAFFFFLWISGFPACFARGLHAVQPANALLNSEFVGKSGQIARDI